MKEVWQKELRKVFILNTGVTYVETPTLDEYYSRLKENNMFKIGGPNSPGACWFRSFAGTRDISKYALY